MLQWLKKKMAGQPVTLNWEEYKGFRIAAAPINVGGQFRVAGEIELGDGDGKKVHSFTRADLIASKKEAEEFSLMKARLLIDQLGESLFS